MRAGAALPLGVAIVCLAVACGEAPAPPTGAQLFAKHCASCHGPSGAGDGPVAASLSTPPSNLRTLAQRNGGKFDEAAVVRAIDGRRAVAAHGPRDMPVWGDVFESEFAAEGAPRPAGTSLLRTRLLTEYVASLQER